MHDRPRQGLVLVFVLTEVVEDAGVPTTDIWKKASAGYSDWCSSRYGCEHDYEYDYRYEERFGCDYCHEWDGNSSVHSAASGPSIEYANDLVRHDLGPHDFVQQDISRRNYCPFADCDAHVQAYRERLTAKRLQAQNMLTLGAEFLRLGADWLHNASQQMNDLARMIPASDEPQQAERPAVPSAPPARVGRNPWLDLDMGL